MLRKAEFEKPRHNGYPTSDGRPMAETDRHRLLMTDLIETLSDHFADRPDVYVSGNLLLFYEPTNKRKHVSPDVFVVFGVPKAVRPNYLTWEEGKGPDVVIELTSSTTRKEDQTKKWTLYRDVLAVPEYFLFDPLGDYLKPRFQGYRLSRGEYKPIKIVDGRMVSRKLGLVLEPDGEELRLVDPVTGVRLPTHQERLRAAEAEAERLRREVEQLRRRPGNGA